MVTKKKLGIIALLTTVVVLLTALFAIGAQASSEPTLSIAYANISLDEEAQIFNIKYAVSVSDDILERLGEVRMLNWTSEDESGKYEASENDSATVGWQMIGGVQHAIFDFACDLSALSDMVYARAYIDVDGTKYYSGVNKYNFITYAFNKQNTADTKTAEIIAATERLGDMLVASKHGVAVESVTPAQKLEFRMPSAEWRRVRVKNAALEDGFGWGMYLDGDVLTASAVKEGTLCHLADTTGSDILGNSITVSGSMDYTAVYSSNAVDKLTHSHSWSANGTESEGKIVVPTNSQIKADYLESLWDEGYTHLVFTAEFDTAGDFIHPGPVWDAQWVSVQAGVPKDVRFDISEFCIDGTWYGTNVINMTGGNITISNARAYKSAETLLWTKSASNSYFAIEDGYYVFETRQGGASVLSPTEWVEKYSVNTAEVKQWLIYTDWLEQGSNNRDQLYGWGAGSIIHTLSETPNGGWHLWGGKTNAYTEGDAFHLINEYNGTSRFKISDWVANNAGSTLTVVDNDTVIWSGADGHKIRLATTQELIAQGYTKLLVTFKGDLGSAMIWWGDDDWGDGEFALDASKFTEGVYTFEVDLTGAVTQLQFDSNACFTLMGNAAAFSDIEITVIPSKGTETPEPPVCTEHADANGDEKCDNCGADVPAVTHPAVITPETLLTSSAWSAGGTESEGKIVVPASSQIKTDYLKSLWDEGYTHLVFTVNAAAGGDNAFMHGGEWDRYWRGIETNVDQVIRIDLNEFHDGDTWYSLNFSKGEMTVSNVKAYKSAETLSWTKIGAGKPSNVYFAIEDGYYVLDTITAQGVTSPTEWLEKYCVADDASQRSWRVYTDWLNKGGNTRSLLWGWGSAVNTIHGDVNGGWTWLNGVQTDGYTDGEIFSLHTDTGGTARFKILDWVSNRNEWNAQQKLDYVNENTIIWSGADSYKIRLATTQDLIAQGYTKLTITVKGDLGSAMIWYGNDDWNNDGGEYNFTADNFTDGVFTIEVDLTATEGPFRLNNGECITFMGNAAAFTDLEITAVPSK